MRYLVLSDIHANQEALNAVLMDAAGAYDEVLNCGDVVGYGPDPNEVVDWCRANTRYLVRGNHDVACATLEHLDWFNEVAAASVHWTHARLTPGNLAYLAAIPQGPLRLDGVEIAHGSPVDEDEYLMDSSEIREAARHVESRVAFFGHTHMQGCFEVEWNGVRPLRLTGIDLDPNATYMVNPGSVGQPRDRNPGAAYALYDSTRLYIELRRVDYDIAATQDKIRRAGLPDLLATRLRMGR